MKIITHRHIILLLSIILLITSSSATGLIQAERSIGGHISTISGQDLINHSSMPFQVPDTPAIIHNPSAQDSGQISYSSEREHSRRSTSETSVPNRIFVRYNSSQTSASALCQVAETYIIREYTDPDLKGLVLLSVPEDSMQTALQTYSHSPGILYAEPDYIWGISRIPDDPEFSKQWGFQNTGQVYWEGKPAGISGADAKITKAWDITTGSQDIVVAVLDSGIDYTHPDLSGNMWRGPSGEYGYDFVNRDSDPMDDNGHGTHCAGIIGAVGNNGIGVAGVSWKIRLMAVKVLGPDGKGEVANIIEGIKYADRMGADVVSCSFGGDNYSQAAFDAISTSPFLMVCAAGNAGKNNDITPVYPASYKIPSIIGVAATTARDELASYSNYGSSVHLAAPGDQILSTYRISASGTLTTTGTKNDRKTTLIQAGNGKYAYISGTSQATALVAGMSALLNGLDTTLSPEKIKSLLVTYSDSIPSFIGRVAANGRVNLYAAVQAISSHDNLPLHTGWNFISVPRPLAAGSDTAEIFASVNSGGHSLLTFESGSWRKMKVSDEISVMTGYWIYSMKEDSVPVIYQVNPGIISRSVTTGWNIYGLPSRTQMTAKSALSPIVSIWRYLIGYDGKIQQYDEPIVNGGLGGSSDERILQPFKGYWLYSSGEGRLEG